MQKPWSTIRELIAAQAHARPEEPAILGPDRSVLTFGGLWNHIEQIGERLRALGVQRGDIVASVLPNGPDAATGLFCVAPVATFVPLNPDGRKPEYDTLFLELTPRILLVPAGAAAAHPAAFAARGLGVPVIEVLSGEAAGVFTLEGHTGYAPAAGEPAAAEDFAYIIATSGTTARPKLVPMPQHAVCVTQGIVESAMALTPADRALNISPLFHSLGLGSGLISPVGAGGSVVCLPGFQARHFFDHLADFKATWFAAVPSVLQTILEHAPANREKLARSRVRMIRTTGAPLAPEIAAGLEREFRAPVLLAYGMSEAPCIASDRYPRDERRAGSVGRALTDGVQVRDAEGRPAPTGINGDIVVRGPWIIPAYYRNEAATASAFDGGWFHTGDTGYFDADGYLFLTGRRKEFINRGGEKISPVEVDEVLLSHPAVAEVVTFAVPDARLGEEVAAAVVLLPRSAVSAAALQEFAASHLSLPKVPRKIVFVAELPKGPTGKLSRFRMAAELGLDRGSEDRFAHAPSAGEEPPAPLGLKLAAIFAQVLGRPRVGLDESFFDLGGDSLAALECLAAMEAECHLAELSPALLLWAPTPAKLAVALTDISRAGDSAQVFTLQPEGSGPPLFLVAPGLEAHRLARHLGEDRPLYGVRVPNLEHLPHPHTIERMAAECVSALRRFRSSGSYALSGPIALAGWCSAGVIALEIARQLEAEGDHVAFVALLDARGLVLPPMSAVRSSLVRAVRWASWISFHAARPQPWKRIRAGAARRIRGALEGWRRGRTQLPASHAAAGRTALRQYRPQPWPGRILHVWAAERPHGPFRDAAFEWRHVAAQGFAFHEVPGDHLGFLREPNVAALARILAEELDRVAVAAR